MNIETLKKNLSYTNRFLGYGNPFKATVYFFGIEEYGEFEEHEFYESRSANKRYLIPDKNKSTGRTENLQSALTFRLLKNVQNFSMNCTEEEFKRGEYEFENPMFCSNLYPLGSNRDSKWSSTNIKLTGYKSKEDYRQQCLTGACHFQTIISRKEVLTTFLKLIKRRMESSPIFIFVMGHNKNDQNSPGNVFKELFSNVFEIQQSDFDCASQGKITNYRGQSIIHICRNRVWITPHARVLSYADLDKIIEVILRT
jgi:hypothetical protein